MVKMDIDHDNIVKFHIDKSMFEFNNDNLAAWHSLFSENSCVGKNREAGIQIDVIDMQFKIGSASMARKTLK